MIDNNNNVKEVSGLIKEASLCINDSEQKEQIPCVAAEAQLTDYLDTLIQGLESGDLELDQLSDSFRLEHNRNVLRVLDHYETKLAVALRSHGSLFEEANAVVVPELMNDMTVSDCLRQVVFVVSSVIQEMSSLHERLILSIDADDKRFFEKTFDNILRAWIGALDQVSECFYDAKDDLLREKINRCISKELVERTNSYLRRLCVAQKAIDQVPQSCVAANTEKFIANLLHAQRNTWHFWKKRIATESAGAITSQPTGKPLFLQQNNDRLNAEAIVLAEAGFEPTFFRHSTRLATLLTNHHLSNSSLFKWAYGGVAVGGLRHKFQVLTLNALEYASTTASLNRNTNIVNHMMPVEAAASPNDLQTHEPIAITDIVKGPRIIAAAHKKDIKENNAPKNTVLHDAIQRLKNHIPQRLNLSRINFVGFMGSASSLLPVKAPGSNRVKEITEDLKSLRAILTDDIPTLIAVRGRAVFGDKNEVEWFRHKKGSKTKLEIFAASINGLVRAEIFKKEMAADKTSAGQLHFDEAIGRRVKMLNALLSGSNKWEIKIYKDSSNNNAALGIPLPVLNWDIAYQTRAILAAGFFSYALQLLTQAEESLALTGKSADLVRSYKELLFRILDRQVTSEDITVFRSLLPTSAGDHAMVFEVIRTDLNSKGFLFQSIVQLARKTVLTKAAKRLGFMKVALLRSLSADATAFDKIAHDVSSLKVAVMRSLNKMPARKMPKDNAEAISKNNNAIRRLALIAEMERRALLCFQKRFIEESYKPKMILNDDPLNDFAMVKGERIGAEGDFTFYKVKGSNIVYVVDKSWLQRAVESNGALIIPKSGQRFSTLKQVCHGGHSY